MSDTGIITDEILSLRKRAELAEARAAELEAQAAQAAQLASLIAFVEEIDKMKTAQSGAYLSALEAEHKAALLLNDSMSPARELIDFDGERFASAVREWREKIAAVEAAKGER